MDTHPPNGPLALPAFLKESRLKTVSSFYIPVHHDHGEVLAVVDELVHEGHASGASAHHKVVTSEGGHLLQEWKFVKIFTEPSHGNMMIIESVRNLGAHNPIYI